MRPPHTFMCFLQDSNDTVTRVETRAMLNIFRLIAAVAGVSHRAINMRLTLSFFERLNEKLFGNLSQQSWMSTVEVYVISESKWWHFNRYPKYGTRHQDLISLGFDLMNHMLSFTCTPLPKSLTHTDQHLSLIGFFCFPPVGCFPVRIYPRHLTPLHWCYCNEPL